VNLLKPNDVARQLSVSRAWVYEAARTGRIPSVRIGGEDGPLRFVPEEIDRWITECRAPWATTPSIEQKGVPRDRRWRNRPRASTVRSSSAGQQPLL
jgi:excisionase family DNA binding protein